MGPHPTAKPVPSRGSRRRKGRPLPLRENSHQGRVREGAAFLFAFQHLGKMAFPPTFGMLGDEC